MSKVNQLLKMFGYVLGRVNENDFEKGIRYDKKYHGYLL